MPPPLPVPFDGGPTEPQAIGLPDVRHVRSQLDLRRHHDRRLDRKLGMVVANHDGRRSDLLHRSLGSLPFGACSLSRSPPPPPPPDVCSFFWVMGNCGRQVGSDQGHRLFGLVLLDGPGAHDRESDQSSNHGHMDHCGDSGAFFLVVVLAPDFADFYRPRGQHKRRQLFGKQRSADVVLQRAPQRLVHVGLRQQMQIFLLFGRGNQGLVSHKLVS